MNIAVPEDGRLCADTLAQATRPSVNGQACHIDLRTAQFIDTAGLVAVAATAQRARDAGRSVHFDLPALPDVRNYVTRMHLPHVLRDLGASADAWRDVSANDLRGQLAEVHAFDSEQALTQVVDRIVTVFAKFERRLAQPLYNALLELGLNAVQHSRKDLVGSGFVAVQTFRQAGDVAFAVADAGRGLRSSLSDAMGVPSDAAAIRLAARKHVSSEGDPGRGRGITGVIELTGRHRGEVTMVSGSALGVFSGGHWDPRVSRLENPFPGTLAQTRLAFEGRLEV